MGRKHLTKEEILSIKEKYKNGVKVKELEKEFNCTNFTIYKVINRENLNKVHGNRRFDINESYFNIIDSERKAYFLGLIWADGSILKSKGTLSIHLQKEDEYLLEELRNDICPSKPLKYYQPKNPKWKERAILNIYSYPLINSLINIGCVPNKRQGVEFPNCIPDNLLIHFIRGYFDGDGCVTISEKSEKNSRRFTIGFTGAIQFIEQLKKILLNVLNVEFNKVVFEKRNKVTSSIHLRKYSKLNDFYDKLYDDATIFLKRKKEKYEKIKTWKTS